MLAPSLADSSEYAVSPWLLDIQPYFLLVRLPTHLVQLNKKLVFADGPNQEL
jgi:hypothetical protein